MSAITIELPSQSQRPLAAPRGEGAAARAEACDEALAQRAQLGGPDAATAFGVLVERYEARLVSFLARRTGSRHEAEDLAQEAFLRAWNKIETFDPSRRFSAWLFTVAARVAASKWRKRKVGSAEMKDVEGGRPDERAPSSGIWAVAERVLDAETMSALWLRYAADLEPGEIAMVLGRTGVGVRVMLHRARKKIAAEMQGWTPDDNAATMPEDESERGR